MKSIPTSNFFSQWSLIIHGNVLVNLSCSFFLKLVLQSLCIVAKTMTISLKKWTISSWFILFQNRFWLPFLWVLPSPDCGHAPVQILQHCFCLHNHSGSIRPTSNLQLFPGCWKWRVSTQRSILLFQCLFLQLEISFYFAEVFLAHCLQKVLELLLKPLKFSRFLKCPLPPFLQFHPVGTNKKQV